MPDPIRTCIGCREKCPKEFLIRYVFVPELRRVNEDLQQVSFGRGSYVHPDEKCKQIARKRMRSALRISHDVDLDVVEV